jgi:integrase
VVSGNSRQYTNRQTRRVIRIFRYACFRELVRPDQIVALDTIEPLRYGQTQAGESDPVTPVDIETVRLTARHLSPIIKAMVRIHAATGMRPSELCMIRPIDIERRPDGVWIYAPQTHKTKHRGTRRTIPIVGDAKLALRPYLDRDPEAYCFSPREAREQRYAALRRNRKSRVQPSQTSPLPRPSTRSPERRAAGRLGGPRARSGRSDGPEGRGAPR